MKIRVLSLIIIISLIFVFIIFYKSLNESSYYKPISKIQDIPKFYANSFYSKKEINSIKIFDEDKYYLFNIWASWCLPCRDEHPILVKLSKNNQLKLIGLNYKDNLINAQKFLDELGDPYEIILIDKDGTKAIEWGAFGVPETFLIYKNKVVKKFIGPLDQNLLLEIEKTIK